MCYHLHQPCCRTQLQQLQSQGRHALILWDLRRHALVQQPGRICLNRKIRRKIVGRRIHRRFLWLRGRLGRRTLRAAKKGKDHEKANDLRAQKVQVLKNEGSSAPGGQQQAKGSGMSHPTRMGPTPTLTQILSYTADILPVVAGARPKLAKEACRPRRRYTSHRSTAFRSDTSGSPVGTNSCATYP